MAVKIKGAPQVGWYFPEQEGETYAPHLWTGVARFQGSRIVGLVITITKHESGPQLLPQWEKPSVVKGLPKGRTFVPTVDLPTVHRGQDIREMIRQAHERMERERAAQAA